MKTFVVLLLCFLLLISFALPVYSHSGRTDSQGGHTNHSTGDYHFHHGYPEHEHKNGHCPYDEDISPSFKDVFDFNFIISFVLLWFMITIGVCKLGIGDAIVFKINSNRSKNSSIPLLIDIIISFLVTLLLFFLLYSL